MSTASRKTDQRAAIVAAFEAAGRPLGPAEVLAAAQSGVPAIGMATVYRNIKSLLAAGWLSPVLVPGESPRYERRGKKHHHHFRCRRCDVVYEIDGCPGDLAPLVPTGFTLEDHDLMLYGTCSTCGPARRRK